MEHVKAKYDVVVAGSGAAAHGSALHAARYQMSLAMFVGEFGGETASRLSGCGKTRRGVCFTDAADLIHVATIAVKHGLTVRSLCSPP